MSQIAQYLTQQRATMEIRLPVHSHAELREGMEVMFTQDYLHVDNTTQVLKGERGIVEVMPCTSMGLDSCLTIYLYKQHDSLAEWDNRIIFAPDTYDSEREFVEEIEKLLKIAEDEQDYPANMLERALRDLKKITDDALETITYGRVDASKLETLQAVLENETVPFPNRMRADIASRAVITRALENYLRAYGYR